MVKCRVIKLNVDIDIFTIPETLFENVITILPITYQKKTKMSNINKKYQVYF